MCQDAQMSPSSSRSAFRGTVTGRGTLARDTSTEGCVPALSCRQFREGLGGSGLRQPREPGAGFGKTWTPRSDLGLTVLPPGTGENEHLKSWLKSRRRAGRSPPAWKTGEIQSLCCSGDTPVAMARDGVAGGTRVRSAEPRNENKALAQPPSPGTENCDPRERGHPRPRKQRVWAGEGPRRWLFLPPAPDISFIRYISYGVWGKTLIVIVIVNK